MLTTNVVAITTNVTIEATNLATAATQSAPATNLPAASNQPEILKSGGATNQTVLPSFAKDEQAIKARKEIARRINQFIQNTRSGTLGVTGSVLLIFVGISMLGRIEDTFNDIWGVARGRSWFMRLVLYWGVISLAPL